MQPFSRFVAWRYCLPGLHAGLSGFLSLASLLGLVLGVFALIVVISVMNGFERELQGRILSLLPHAEIEAKEGLLSEWETLQNQLVQDDDIVGVSPYAKSTVMLTANNSLYPAQLTGINLSTERDVSVLPNYIIAGDITRLVHTPYGIVIGEILARQLNVYPGDKINLIVPKVRITPLGPLTRQKRFEVVAVFKVGAELDQNLALINLSSAQKLLAFGEKVSGLRVSVEPKQRDLAYAITNNALQQINPPPSDLDVIAWQQSQGSLFRAIKMEKIMIFILLMSVVAVAAFNIVSIILMTVMDKRSDIAVLRTMGANAKQIKQVFMLQGVFIGVLGTLLGAILGVTVAPNVGALLQYVEGLSGWQLFDPSVYYIPYLPSELRLLDVVIVMSTACLISVLASWYPASRAALIAPAEALANEA